MSEKRAAIDIGSNSTLMIVGKKLHHTIEVLQDFSEVTSLGLDLDKNGFFLESKMDLTFETLREYQRLAFLEGVSSDEIIATATEASRVASNAHSFYEKVQNELGIKVAIINGRGEAYYTARGISLDKKMKERKNVIVIDIGGASTELIKIKLNPFVVENSISLPVGVVRIFNWREQNCAEEKFSEIIGQFNLRPYLSEFVMGVAGSVTSLAAMYLQLSKYEDEKVGHLVLTRSDLENFCQEVESMHGEQISIQFPYLKKRAFVLPASAWLVRKFLEPLGVKSFSVSTFGLRHGTLYEGGVRDEFIA